MSIPRIDSSSEMLARIKDPASRMRLAIKQDTPDCANCIHWIETGFIPWCKKFEHQKDSNPLDNTIENRYFCPDFNDRPE